MKTKEWYKNMKKICFFMNTPFNLGGEQRIVTVLANYLVNNGYDVSFLLTNSNHIIDREIYNMDEKIKIIYIKEYNKLNFRLKRKILSKISLFNSYTGLLKNKLNILKNFYCIKEEYEIMDKYFKNEKFDYIIAIGHYYSGKLALLKNKLKFNTKIIAWEHNCYKAYFETKGLRYFNQDVFFEFLIKNYDNYIVQTKDDFEKIKEKFNFEPLIINNSNTFNVYEKNAMNNKSFVAAGRFSHVKNFPFLISCFNEFHKKNKEWNLTIYGQGKEYKKCQKLVKKYNLENFVFLPGKTSNMIEKYRKSSIYILTSLWEGWGMVVTEAMQYGLPIISSNIPSTIEIFGKSNCGTIVNEYTVESFSNAMLEMVKNEKYKKISENCLERVKRFDIENIGKEWINILK